MKNRKFFISLLLALALGACSLPTETPAIDQNAVGTIVALTSAALSTSQVTPTIAAPTRTVTLTPTITATYAPPILHFTGTTNCRSGPGTEYDIVVVIKEGQKADIIALPPSGNYWVIKSPNGKDICWAAGDFAEAEGSYKALPTVTAPPTPTLKPPAAPTWASYNYSCEFATGGNTVTVSLVWTDHASNEQGYNLYRNGELLASLGPDSSAYTDVAFASTGQGISYYVEAYSGADSTQSPVINVACN